jgi:hypothetical protein
VFATFFARTEKMRARPIVITTVQLIASNGPTCPWIARGAPIENSLKLPLDAA